MPTIKSIQIFIAKIPLTKPYPLSFTTVKYIDSIIVKAHFSDNSSGVGEAVPLPGYTSETLESVLNILEKNMVAVIGLESGEAAIHLRRKLYASPFALSAILCALELSSQLFKLPQHINLPLVAPLASTDNPSEVVIKMLSLHQLGYRTIKLKVGRDINSDCMTTQEILNEIPVNTLLRIDANQAYSEKDARRLFEVIEKHKKFSQVEVLEQPFGIESWELTEKIISDFPQIPVMLDESIINEHDIGRAANIGAKLIKLKLFKHETPGLVKELIEKAHNLGLGIVFGNGVCSCVGNLIEASIFQASDYCQGAFEGNGFEKLIYSNIKNKPVVKNGNMIWSSKEQYSLTKMLIDDLYQLKYEVIG